MKIGNKVTLSRI